MLKKSDAKDLKLDEILLPNWQIFLFLAIINVLISFWAHRFIFTRDLYHSLLSDQMELSRIDNFVDILARYSYLSMLVIPAVLFIKYLINTLLLQLPLLLNYIEIRFTKLFRIVMLSSVVLILGQVVHNARIYFSLPKNITREMLIIKPFSLAMLVKADAYPIASLYVLNQCNLFECLWICFIFFGLLRTNTVKKTDALMLTILVWSIMLFLYWAAYFFIEKLQ